MKQITINLYSFNELSEEAKAKAIENKMNEYNEREYVFGGDAIKSLQKLAEYFGCRLNNYCIDFFGDSPSYVEFSEREEDATDDEILRLGEFDKQTLKGLGSCVLTGYCADEDAIDGLRIAYFTQKERNVNKLLLAGYETWKNATEKDANYQRSEEFACSEIEDTEGENDFLETGEIYKNS